MNKKETIAEVGFILDTYCEGCLVKKFLRQDYGKCAAQKFCIRECTVGEQLKKLGKNLT
ncbi:zinc-finger domain-containing protein [Pseudalkalibacillus caeni]|uniref:Zinc-finger domain-containing protein n=1 Tax=Exobacillus caeni TaxID=2574798 RepID=A0A5R9F526_9BACL|nr:zinc-finger domain-containing protein [Pseudalkalibacillus caeni]TLS37500.1 zinc-finger domain-containing protein [Pseudalkalibacillus caeni]